MHPIRMNTRGVRALAAVLALFAAPVLAQEPAPAGQLTRAPELLHFVEATYPAEAAAHGLTADVVLAVTIAEDGSVTDAVVTAPAGQGFDEAALAAVRAFRFRPAEVDGKTAPVQIAYTYRFVLRQVEEPAPPAPRAVLKGELLSRGSRSRVEGATVRCGDTPDAPEAVSDARGHFTLEVPAGDCQVRVSSATHQLFQAAEQLRPDETTEVVYHLLPRPSAYQTVVRGAREKREVVRRTLTKKELTTTPGTMGDPIRVIQTLPGVARAPFLSGELLVRGSNPGQTSTLMDGVDIPILFHLGGGPSVVNAEFLDQLDFYPGGYSAQYGRAVGGVVDVSTRKGAVDTLHGSVKVDLLDTGAFVEAPVGEGVSVALAARRSYIDVLLPLVLERTTDGGGTRSVVPRYWDWQARVDWGDKRGEAAGAGPRSTYYVMGFGADDVLRVVTTGDVADRDLSLDLRTRFTRLKGDWTWRHGRLSSVFTPYTGYDEYDAAFGTFTSRDRVLSVGAREVLRAELGERVILRTGFDVLFDNARSTVRLPAPGGYLYVPFPGAAPEAELQQRKVQITGFDGGLFLEADLKVGAVTVTPGLRGNWQRSRATQNLAIDPRLWLRLDVDERMALKGSVGLYSQAPHSWELLLAPWGNPELPYQRAFQTSVGWEQRLTEALSLDLTAYVNRRYQNVVSPGQVVVDETGAHQLRFAPTGVGRSYGLELMAKHAPGGRFSGWVSYTLSRSLDGRTDEAEAITPFDWPSAEGYQLSDWDQTHVLTAVGTLKLPRNWELGARFRFTSGRPHTPLRHPYDLFDADGNAYARLEGLPKSARSKAFQQLDLRMEKSWLYDRWSLAAYLDVQNVYFAQNVEAVFNDYRFRSEVEVPGLPFLPVTGVKVTF